MAMLPDVRRARGPFLRQSCVGTNRNRRRRPPRAVRSTGRCAHCAGHSYCSPAGRVSPESGMNIDFQRAAKSFQASTARTAPDAPAQRLPIELSCPPCRRQILIHGRGWPEAGRCPSQEGNATSFWIASRELPRSEGSEDPAGRRLLQTRDESFPRHRRGVTDPQALEIRHDLPCAAGH